MRQDDYILVRREAPLAAASLFRQRARVRKVGSAAPKLAHLPLAAEQPPVAQHDRRARRAVEPAAALVARGEEDVVAAAHAIPVQGTPWRCGGAISRSARISPRLPRWRSMRSGSTKRSASSVQRAHAAAAAEQLLQEDDFGGVDWIAAARRRGELGRQLVHVDSQAALRWAER